MTNVFGTWIKENSFSLLLKYFIAVSLVLNYSIIHFSSSLKICLMSMWKLQFLMIKRSNEPLKDWIKGLSPDYDTSQNISSISPKTIMQPIRLVTFAIRLQPSVFKSCVLISIAQIYFLGPNCFFFPEFSVTTIIGCNGNYSFPWLTFLHYRKARLSGYARE